MLSNTPAFKKNDPDEVEEIENIDNLIDQEFNIEDEKKSRSRSNSQHLVMGLRDMKSSVLYRSQVDNNPNTDKKMLSPEEEQEQE